MNTGLIIALSVTGGVIFLWVVLNVVMQRVRKKLEQRVLQKFNLEEIVCSTTRSNFFGEESQSAFQARGNGALVLTKEELCFMMVGSDKEFTIPLKSIISVSLPKSFKGKSIFVSLLCVRYQKNGEEDAMAWSVPTPEKWKQVIESLMSS